MRFLNSSGIGNGGSSNSSNGFGFGHGRLLGKSFRWLRWSTLCAILFYMFFIGLILHSTNHKLQHTQLKSSSSSTGAAVLSHHHPHQQQQQQQPQHHIANSNSNPKRNHKHYNNHNNEINDDVRTHRSMAEQQEQQQHDLNSLASKSNVLQMPPSAAPSTSMQHNDVNGVSSSSNSNRGNGSGSGSQSHRNDLIANGNGVNGNNKPNEPETVIFAASSVNEKQILEKTFRRADKNADGRLNIQELAFYINRKIIEHIDDAIQRNPREFRRVDIAPADGLISWEEYHNYFIREHGLSEADLDEHGEIRQTSLNRHTREQLLRDKARWTEVARTDIFSLTIDEFLAFRHPESSVTNLLELVDDLLRQFDQDGDDQLSLEEFSDVSVNDDEDLIRKSLISRTVVERRAEFKRILDRNHDGKADREELLHYVDPKTPRYALQESATLFALADENHDDWLTLDELVANAEIFLTSKMIDTANSFHTDF